MVVARIEFSPISQNQGYTISEFNTSNINTSYLESYTNPFIQIVPRQNNTFALKFAHGTTVLRRELMSGRFFDLIPIGNTHTVAVDGILTNTNPDGTLCYTGIRGIQVYSTIRVDTPTPQKDVIVSPMNQTGLGPTPILNGSVVRINNLNTTTNGNFPVNLTMLTGAHADLNSGLQYSVDFPGSQSTTIRPVGNITQTVLSQGLTTNVTYSTNLALRVTGSFPSFSGNILQFDSADVLTFFSVCACCPFGACSCGPRA